MIFVTVGTHEQQFNRLIKAADKIAENERVIIQLGYSDYVPKNAEYASMIPFEKMKEYIENADVVITHGGPGCIMLALESGKMPIVVPRLEQYGEHVNNHQLYFCRHLADEGSCILVESIEQLNDAVVAARSCEINLSEKILNERAKFTNNLERIINTLLNSY